MSRRGGSREGCGLSRLLIAAWIAVLAIWLVLAGVMLVHWSQP